jgi:ABC-type transport system substrate-binding protein
MKDMYAAPRRHLCFKNFALLFVFAGVFLFGTVWGSEARAANIIKIGLLQEPKSLNVWRATDRWSRRVLSRIYQPLYIREPKELKLIPWLAEGDPVYDPANLSYTVKIRPAKWSDGTEVTSEDVAFTGNIIKEFKVPRDYSRWSFVKKIETVDKRTVRFFLEKPKAIFLTRTLATSIVQKKEWEKVAEEARKGEKPLAGLLNHEVKTPVGVGPFAFKEWKRGAYIFLERNRHFFGQGKDIAGYVLGPHIDGIIFKVFGTSDAAIMALKKGSIDMFWWGIQPGYLEDLEGDKDIETFRNERSALYFLGFNLRKKPFSDVHFRHAVATLIDKDFIIKRILQGHGVEMHSIVPPGNSIYHCPDLPRYGEGLNRKERVLKAYEILRKAGYTWKVPPVNAEGKVVNGEGIILPDGSPMADFTILTPQADYDPHRAMAGMLAQEWLRRAGIPATSKPMAFSALMQQVKAKHQFDLFVLGYGSLSLDPDYLRNFFHSRNDKPRGWNMGGYKNPDFDKIADDSSEAMEDEKRKALIWEMQRIIMRDIPYFPLYNPRLIEAVRKDTFGGWVQMLEGVGNSWSFCQIRPAK